MCIGMHEFKSSFNVVATCGKNSFSTYTDRRNLETATLSQAKYLLLEVISTTRTCMRWHQAFLFHSTKTLALLIWKHHYWPLYQCRISFRMGLEREEQPETNQIISCLGLIPVWILCLKKSLGTFTIDSLSLNALLVCCWLCKWLDSVLTCLGSDFNYQSDHIWF